MNDWIIASAMSVEALDQSITPTADSVAALDQWITPTNVTNIAMSELIFAMINSIDPMIHSSIASTMTITPSLESIDALVD